MNPTKTTARDFFLYLGIMIGLYVSSISFLMLIFQIINKAFPLTGEYLGQIDYSIRSTLAAIIIFFPAFVYLSWIINKDLKSSPEKKDIWVRRWLIFFTLFISGLAIAIDLTTLIYRFLGAEDLTLRFFLKVLAVLAVTITIFKSCLYDLKRDVSENSKFIKISFYGVSAVILAGIIGGMIIIGSPNSQRAKTLDDRRINDLMSIQSQIVYSQWQNKGTVPGNLEVLNDPISNFIVPSDPETKGSYEYKKLSENSFELCATFKTDNKDTKDSSMVYRYGIENENWQHGIGRTCFTRTIDPNLYKVTPVK